MTKGSNHLHKYMRHLKLLCQSNIRRTTDSFWSNVFAWVVYHRGSWWTLAHIFYPLPFYQFFIVNYFYINGTFWSTTFLSIRFIIIATNLASYKHDVVSFLHPLNITASSHSCYGTFVPTQECIGAAAISRSLLVSII